MTNCNKIMESLGYQCISRGDIVILNTPFFSPLDGSGLQLFIHEKDGGFLVSDNGQSADDAWHHDIDLKKDRLEGIRSVVGNNLIDDDWSINLLSSKEDLSETIAKATETLLTLSSFQKLWLPEPNEEVRFKKRLELFLENNVTETLEHNYKVTGYSGHSNIIPFAVIKNEDSISLIHYLSLKGGRVNWRSANMVSGIMNDIKDVEIAHSHVKRYVVIEDRTTDDKIISDVEISKVKMLLSSSSSVLPYSRKDDWVSELAA